MKSRIKAVRNAVGKNQTEFGRSVKVSLSAVQKWESGENVPSDAVITLICRTYGVSEVWLRSGDGEMFKPRTDKDDIAAFVGDMLGDGGSDFQRRFVTAIAKLSPAEWAAVERKMREILQDEGTKKDPVV